MSQSRETSAEYAKLERLSASHRHRLLAVGRRRMVIDVLAARTTPVDLADVATAVASRETDGGVPDDQTVHAVETALHHVHLPKLATAGLLDYDAERNRVEPSSDHSSA